MSTITCVYCGMAYPPGTPSSGAHVPQLTDHIKACHKHPLHAAGVRIAALESACLTMLGVSRGNLSAFREQLLRMPDSDERSVAVQMIDALLSNTDALG